MVTVKISGTPITVPRAVILVIATARLVNGGIANLNACGSMIQISAWFKLSPDDLAASIDHYQLTQSGFKGSLLKIR